MTEQQTPQSGQQTRATGSPVWTDISAPDAVAARSFYTQLFAWDVVAAPGDESGGYGTFLQGGKRVAGVGTTRDVHEPAVWTTYMLTEDADATAAKVVVAGGQVAVPPVAVGPHGTMAIFIDPTGAFFGVWQPGAHRGADLYHVPVSVAWNELQSADMAAASSFYETVFGWETETSPFEDAEYTMWKIDGRGVAGGMPLGITLPTDTPSHWLIFFAVRNCPDTVAHAQELGASVLAEPVRSEDGLYAVLRDPQGAIFGVISV